MRTYRIHHERTRFREFVNLSYPRVIRGAIAWLPLKFGLLSWKPQIIPHADTIADHMVSESQLPDFAKPFISESVANAATLGFIDPTFECIESQGRRVVGVCARCCHTSGRYIFQSLFSFAGPAHSSEQHVVSFFEGGVTLASSNGHPKFDRHPSAEAYYYPNCKLSALLASHDAKLAQRVTSPIIVSETDKLIKMVDAMRDRFLDYMLSRGLYEEIEPTQN